VLAGLPRALKVATHTVVVRVPYSYFERAQRLVAAHAGQVIGQAFAVEVTLTLRFAVERLPAFQGALREMSNGALQADIIETNPATILPLAAD
jgi:putative IMPACT (imprinted ancient) family translation regulator